MIQILAWDNAGNVTISKDKNSYTYHGIYQNSLQDIKKILNSKRPNKVWQYLKNFKFTKE
jgi:hypothetical protein